MQKEYNAINLVDFYDLEFYWYYKIDYQLFLLMGEGDQNMKERIFILGGEEVKIQMPEYKNVTIFLYDRLYNRIFKENVKKEQGRYDIDKLLKSYGITLRTKKANLSKETETRQRLEKIIVFKDKVYEMLNLTIEGKEIVNS